MSAEFKPEEENQYNNTTDESLENNKLPRKNFSIQGETVSYVSRKSPLEVDLRLKNNIFTEVFKVTLEGPITFSPNADILITDTLPGPKESEDKKVILVSQRPETFISLQEIRENKVVAILNENQGFKELHVALSMVEAGMAYISADRLLAEQPSLINPVTNSKTGLTNKEQEIIEFIVKSRKDKGIVPTNKELAKKFFISVYTVKNHIHQILKKIGRKQRIEIPDWYNEQIGF